MLSRETCTKCRKNSTLEFSKGTPVDRPLHKDQWICILPGLPGGGSLLVTDTKPPKNCPYLFEHSLVSAGKIRKEKK